MCLCTIASFETDHFFSVAGKQSPSERRLIAKWADSQYRTFGTAAVLEARERCSTHSCPCLFIVLLYDDCTKAA